MLRPEMPSAMQWQILATSANWLLTGCCTVAGKCSQPPQLPWHGPSTHEACATCCLHHQHQRLEGNQKCPKQNLQMATKSCCSHSWSWKTHRECQRSHLTCLEQECGSSSPHGHSEDVRWKATLQLSTMGLFPLPLGNIFLSSLSFGSQAAE